MYSDLRHDNMDGALNRLKVFMAALPYELENKTEKHFQTIIFVIFKMMTKYVDVEISTATGRIDMVLKTNTRIYVMEFKLDKSAEEAIAQIDTKDYLISYQLDDRKKVKVGINFSSETRTLDDWIIA
jgi:ATP-dependent exoDNAse (exonuclease V) beta subunit